MLNPMPTVSSLNNFYQSNYWNSRGKSEGVTIRDITHYFMITELLPGFFATKKTILNFGAGHGGISHLFWAAGHNVINVEPSKLDINYDERWTNLSNIEKVEHGTVDFVYGSHSREHLQSLELFEQCLANIAKTKSYFFWEVPNGKCKKKWRSK